MKDKTWNVAAACFAGATIGWIVMTILGFGFTAIVAGTVMSSLIGFFATSPAQSRDSLVRAWRESWPIVVDAVSIPFVVVGSIGYGIGFVLYLLVRFAWDVFLTLAISLPPYLRDIALACVRATWRFARLLFVGVHTRYSRMAMVDAPAGMLLTYVGLRIGMGERFVQMDPLHQLSFLGVAGAVSLLIGVYNCRVVVPWLKTQPV